MSVSYMHNSNCAFGYSGMMFMRTQDAQPWVVFMIATDINSVSGISKSVTARAVIDDFGTLTLVREWL